MPMQHTLNRLGIACGAIVAIGVVTGLVLEHRARSRLQEQNVALRLRLEQLSPTRAPRPPVPASPPASSTVPPEQMNELLRLRGEFGVLRRDQDEAARLQAENSRMRSNWVEQILGGKKLTLEQIAPYLEAKQRSAESLVAAYRATGELGLLREAVEKYPNDPRVIFATCFGLKDGATPEERRQRWEALKQSAPDNALANYLSAQDYFKSGQTDLAVQEIAAASGKPQFRDYSGDLADAVAEAYRIAGFSTLEGMYAASAQPLPHLAELRGLGNSLADLAKLYREAGDAASAQGALQMGAALGRRLSEPVEPGTLIQDLVGIAIERVALGALDPASPYDGAGLTVKDRLDELARQRVAIKEAASDDFSWQTLSGPDQLAFFDRMKASGELEALRWARTRQVQR